MQPGAKPKDENIVRPSGFTQPSNAMDVPRAGVAKQKRKKRLIMIGGGVLLLVGITIGLSRLKPAVPSVERSTVWIDTVKRGPMVRQVRGLGTLVPEEIRWIAARTEGRVDKIVVRPGAAVEPDTILLELTSPEVEQAARDAESQYKAVEAELITLRASLQRQLLEQESSAARVNSEYQQAKMEAETNDNLSKNGLVADLTHKTSKIKAQDLAARAAIEQKRLEFSRDSIEPQIASKQAEVEQLKAMAQMRKDQMEQLRVRAGFTGVLQQLPVEVGQRVAAGTNLARVADPTKLKA
jgi:HlyD family secretion protein